MLRNLRFGWKMALLPAVVSVGFLLIIAGTLSFGQRTGERLSRIETDYYPAVELNRDLTEALDSIQVGLQEAVAESNADQLSEIDELRDRFEGLLALVVLDDVEGDSTSSEADELQQRFQIYYERARNASARLAAGDTGAQIARAMKLANLEYDELRDSLEASTETAREQIDSAFASTLAMQRSATGGLLAILVSCLVILIGGSWFVTRNVKLSVAEVARVVAALTEGDLTVSVQVDSGDEIGQALRRSLT